MPHLCSLFNKKSDQECQNCRWLKMIAIYCCVLILLIAYLLRYVGPFIEWGLKPMCCFYLAVISKKTT